MNHFEKNVPPSQTIPYQKSSINGQQNLGHVYILECFVLSIFLISSSRLNFRGMSIRIQIWFTIVFQTTFLASLRYEAWNRVKLSIFPFFLIIINHIIYKLFVQNYKIHRIETSSSCFIHIHDVFCVFVCLQWIFCESDLDTVPLRFRAGYKLNR